MDDIVRIALHDYLSIYLVGVKYNGITALDMHSLMYPHIMQHCTIAFDSIGTALYMCMYTLCMTQQQNDHCYQPTHIPII